MSTSAPSTRLVNAFNGHIADRPSKWWKARSEADEFCRERDRRDVDLEQLREENASLRARVDELEAELAWHTDSSAAVPEAAAAGRPGAEAPPGGRPATPTT